MSNREFYQNEISKGNEYKGEGQTNMDIKLSRPPHGRYAEFDRYEELCRAKDFYELLPQGVTDQLFCTYSTQNGNPRLILKPMKIEVLRLNPTFVAFHDLIEAHE